MVRPWCLLEDSCEAVVYRGTSLIINSPPLGPYSSTKPRALRWSWRGGLFLMSEVLLYSGGQ